MGITEKILKTRVKTPTLGKWSSGFSKVKKFADTNEIPLIAVWTNGDVCGHCVWLEEAAMTKTFRNWMTVSGCVFWLGTSSDTSKDDKYEGTGFNWSRKKKLTGYPFVRVWWKKGKVDLCKSGDYFILGSTRNDGKEMRDKIKKVLKKYDPYPILHPDEQPLPEPQP